MGVTNRHEPNYERIKPPPPADVLQIPVPEPEPDPAFTFSIMDYLPPETPLFRAAPIRLTGKRRQRRAAADAELTALLEQDEPEELLKEGVPYNNAFQILMENPEYSEILEKFTSDDPAQQENLLEQLPVARSLNSKPKNLSYAKVSSKIKLTLKRMRSVFQLQALENEIVDFFTSQPEGFYFNNHATRFQRLLIHGIAQYYGLKSHSFEADDGKRVIKVGNPNLSSFANIRLHAIVQDNRSRG